MKRCVRFGLFAIGLLALAAPSLAQVLAVYDEGSYGFRYDQWPFGSYDGNFDAAGPILDPDIGWEPGQTQSVGGGWQIDADTTAVLAYGAILNPDETVDVAGLVVRSTGTLAPGNYPIDLDTYMSMFLYFDDISNFTVPDPFGDIVEWFQNLEAAHRFGGTAGSITIADISDSTFAGSFSGTMVDIDDILLIITVSDGYYSLTGSPFLTAAPAPGALVTRHGNHPNPFNPKTSLRFSLAEAAPVRVTVHDPAGRCVALLHEGRLAAGEHKLHWDAEALPGGLYLYRIAAPDGVATGKMILLP